MKTPINPVTGDTELPMTMSCEWARNLGGDDRCGFDGRYWEAKAE
jgi:hypothetical protein